jgi:hypothetical protein
LAITDANLFLGRIIPDFFPKIFGPTENEPLDSEATAKAFKDLTVTINQWFREQHAIEVSKVRFNISINIYIFHSHVSFVAFIVLFSFNIIVFTRGTFHRVEKKKQISLNNLQKTRLLLDSFEWPMRQCVDPFAI